MEKKDLDHWSQRAIEVEDDKKVNIPDSFQQDLEYEQIYKFLDKSMTVLEVGCGNGYITNIMRDMVKHIDGIDISGKMIERAKIKFGEKNNSFIHDDIVNPESIFENQYDTVLCVRVIINLGTLANQLKALGNMRKLLRPGGTLILVDGFLDGFEQMSELREQLGISPIYPSKVNFYSSLADVLPAIEEHFEIEHTMHIGFFDLLTRVLYPSIVGEENVKRNTHFTKMCQELARAENPEVYEKYSRVRGFVCRLKK
jgi:SAM-dependent methyltransferase